MLDLTVTSTGEKNAQKLCEQVQRIASEYSGVRLTPKRRKEGSATNAEIVKSLQAHGRDFFSVDNDVTDAVEKAFAEMSQEVLDRIAAQGERGQTARSGKIWEAAIKAYMAAVAKRIEDQRTAGGGTPDALDPAYKAWKQRKHGFTTIGKLTGQLLDNLNPSGDVARNIRLKK